MPPLPLTVGVAEPEIESPAERMELIVFVTMARPDGSVSVTTTSFVTPSGIVIATEYVMVSPIATFAPAVFGRLVATSVFPMAGVFVVIVVEFAAR